ncbi:myogenesis-regulating glycosidase-like isoform X1 [Apostichopus japonicus]|uniref:myogenesis-regulating glycosidase-like isoform X1 n=2 Tax=Stichopus japonicus TaxID=307972 RepID=UPI003AB82548
MFLKTLVAVMIRRKMAKTLLILSAAVAVLSTIFWNDLMTFLGGSATKVYQREGLVITQSSAVSFAWHGKEVLTGHLGTVLWNHPQVCPDSQFCLEWEGNAKLKVDFQESGDIVCHHIHWKAAKDITLLEDCYDMKSAHWYGGGEVFEQQWPLEEWQLPMTPYVSGDFLINEDAKYSYGSMLEPYWLSSNGVAIHVDSSTPLHVGISKEKLCLRSTYENSKYQNHGKSPPSMDYKLCIGRNVKEVHDYMRANFFFFPSSWPDERMFRSPVWSTWAQYKTGIDESSIIEFAKAIRENNFKDSQLEIDDGFQVAHGDFVFDEKKFPNPSKTVQELHDMGFRVTAWVTPFANLDSEAYREGAKLGYWVKNAHGEPGIIKWWNGHGAALDFTNPDAAKWYVDRLKRFQEETGIDSFKFDAGEGCYLIDNFQTHAELSNPCEYTAHYANTVATLGNQIEMRAGCRNQGLPIFFRMMDKHSSWGWDDGLKTMLTTAVTFSIMGYPFILPDMIGGNAYDGLNVQKTVLPDRELFIRWLELTAFLLSMQYSVQPWVFDEEVVRIAHRWTTFHGEVITPMILEIVQKETVVDGSPIIRPLWWIAPTDKYATRIDCEFLVGNDMLVAPVVDKGRRARDVYLPEGNWMDPSGQVLSGGRWYGRMRAPLDEILYFVKQ